MRFAVEAWAPEYGTPADELEVAKGEVNASVEVPEEDWAPLDPRPAPPPGRVLFVDGVRRVDARVWITGDDEAVYPGIAASYAAGVVRCDRTVGDPSARVDRCEVRRGLFSAAPGLAAVTTRHGEYRPCAVGADSPDAMAVGLQQRMGELEAAVAASVDGADLVVVDGPLGSLPGLPCAVGYVKTHHRRYLAPELTAVVTALGPGQRTPLFVTSARWSRHAWYVRLPHAPENNERGAHPLAGVIRGEVSGDIATAEAARLADLATATLPAYASAAHKDPRAPQNLVPIGELERSLRHHLGDATLLYRSLRIAADKGEMALPSGQKWSRR